MEKKRHLHKTRHVKLNYIILLASHLPYEIRICTYWGFILVRNMQQLKKM